MEKEKKLLKNTFIVAVGKISTQLITFFLLPLYTAVLSTKEYGIVELLNTLIGLFLPILTLQIEQGIFRYLIDCRNDKEKETILVTSLLKFLVQQTFLYLIIFSICSFFIKNEYKYFLLANVIVSMFSSVLLQISRGFGDNKRYSFGSFIAGVATVTLNVIFITVFKWGAYGMLVASLIANLLCILYLFLANKVYKFINFKKYDKDILKSLLKYSVPLVPNMLSWWVVDASDRTIISAILDIGKTGIYAAANKFTGVFTTIYNIFNLTWTESAAININSQDKDEFFSKIFDVTIRFFGCIMLGIIAVMPFVFHILINEKFNESYFQIPILMIGGMFNILVSFLGSIYVAKKMTKEIAKTSIYAAIINIVINVILIKKIGLFAASISTLVAYFMMFVYRIIDSRKYVKLKFNLKIIISMIIMLGLSIVAYYGVDQIIRIGVLAIIVIYAITINGKSLKFIVNSITKKQLSQKS